MIFQVREFSKAWIHVSETGPLAAATQYRKLIIGKRECIVQVTTIAMRLAAQSVDEGHKLIFKFDESGKLLNH